MNKLYIAILAIILSGCTTPGGRIDAAQELCEPNGGLVAIEYTCNTYCTNGALFPCRATKAAAGE